MNKQNAHTTLPTASLLHTSRPTRTPVINRPIPPDPAPAPTLPSQPTSGSLTSARSMSAESAISFSSTAQR